MPSDLVGHLEVFSAAVQARDDCPLTWSNLGNKALSNTQQPKNQRMRFLPKPGAGSGSLLLSRGVLLPLFLAVHVGQAEPVVLSPQLVTLPANAGKPLFVDVDGDGRSDLLVIDPVEKMLFYYHQRLAGFTNSPDQVIPLPPQTAWVALCDVEAHPGLELLMSTATGLVYARQNAGRFESERHTLIEANQVFTNHDFPILTSLTANKVGTNDLIPVISARQTVLYHRTSAYEWSPGPPMTLAVKQTTWEVNRGDDEWMLGSHPAHSLHVQQCFRAKPDMERDQEPEHEAIRKIMDDMKKTAVASPPMIKRADLDGDGREDLVLWQVCGKLDVKTDIYVFLRNADQSLPERPTQILHHRGFPIPFGSLKAPSAVNDLKGDGRCELVLLELKTAGISSGGVVEMVLSHGVDWALTIRSFQRGGFSRSPDASVPVTAILPSEEVREWPIRIQGDFNGDGRPDLLVRRSENRWNIFFSTTDGRWFAPQPAMTFDAPASGYFEINDLNGDGLADIIWREPDEPRLSIFMSPPPPAKGKHP
jgi:hypothetical protein